MEIIKVKNYKKFAETLKEKTKCEVRIKLMSNSIDHVHYQLDKDGFPLGVLCVDKGEVSFAPFATHETAQNDQYINVQYMPMFEDFINVLKVFEDMFIEDKEF